MPYAKLGDLSLFYNETNSVENTRYQHLPPLLLLHGSLSSGQDSFARLLPYLVPNWHVLCPDMRGHGKSTAGSLYWNVPMLAQDMLRFLDLLHIENVDIVGHSMGGDVAMSIAVLAPDRCRALVSIGSAGSRNPNLQHWLTRIGQGNKLELHYPHFIRHLVQSHLSAHHGGWRNFLRMTIKNCMRWPNFSATDLMSLKMPFLLLHGSQDPFVNPDEVNNLILHCPKFMEVSIAGAGHTPQGSSCTIKKTATTINNFLLNSQIID